MNTVTRDQSGHGFTWSLSRFRSDGPGVIDVESTREPHYVFTQVALDGGFDAELHCGATYASDTTGLVRPVHSAAQFRTKTADTRLFGVVAELATVEQWYGDRMPEPVRKLLNGAGNDTFHRPHSTPSHLKQTLRHALASVSPMRRHLVEATAFQVLGFQLETLAHVENNAVTPADEKAAHEGFALISAAPDDAPTVNEIARVLRMAPNRLDRAFRATFGQSVFQTTMNIRFDAICTALLAGEPIKAVAARFGYTSVSNFSTAFRRRMGAPPRTWLNQRKGR